MNTYLYPIALERGLAGTPQPAKALQRRWSRMDSDALTTARFALVTAKGNSVALPAYEFQSVSGNRRLGLPGDDFH
jgi:hypothetical protein